MSVPRHPVVCIDLDHTLLDSNTSEAISFYETLRAVGVAEPAVHLDAFSTINEAMWAAVERGEMAAADVRLARFRRFVEQERLDADPAFLAETYARGLATHGDLFPEAIGVLEQIAAAARVALVTNGVSDIQRARIERLDIDGYFDAVVISSEVGVSKPGRGFFDATFAALDMPPGPEVLMVGDSLTSDMRGGIDYGLATCWVNRNGVATDLPVTYEVDSLDALPGIVGV